MKLSKKKSLRTVACRECGLGTAVNKHEAYRAFHSKQVAKWRKARAAEKQSAGPQVGKTTSLEYLLADPANAALFAPDKEAPAEDDFAPSMIYGTLAALAFIVAVAYDLGKEWLKIVLVILAPLVFYPFFRLESARFERWYKQHRQYHRTWLCLRCGSEWVADEAGKR